MNVPAELKYMETDEWAKVDGQTATIGVTDYAQDQLSDVVFVEIIVSVGDMINKGDQIATIESVKAAADVNTPLSGKVIAVNEDLPQAPEMINKDPFGQAWIIKVVMSNADEFGKMMTSENYTTFCEERSH
jgi:glycine cleavage system H protein